MRELLVIGEFHPSSLDNTVYLLARCMAFLSKYFPMLDADIVDFWLDHDDDLPPYLSKYSTYGWQDIDLYIRKQRKARPVMIGLQHELIERYEPNGIFVEDISGRKDLKLLANEISAVISNFEDDGSLAAYDRHLLHAFSGEYLGKHLDYYENLLVKQIVTKSNHQKNVAIVGAPHLKAVIDEAKKAHFDVMAITLSSLT
jgi:hypothetical protein